MTTRDDGWWSATDGNWYPPEKHPDYQVPPEASPQSDHVPPATPQEHPPVVITKQSRRRSPLIAVAVVVLVLFVGGAAFAAYKLLGAGQSSFPVTSPEAFEWLEDEDVFTCVGLDDTEILEENQRVCLYDRDGDKAIVMARADGEAITFQFGGDDLDIDGGSMDFARYLAERFEFPPGTSSEMGATRAIDGRQVRGNLSWTYHGGNGFTLIILPE